MGALRTGPPPGPDAAVAVLASAQGTTAREKAGDLAGIGAAGYSRDFPLERMARDARMLAIGGGTTQAQRNVIASAIFRRRFSQHRDEG